MYSTRSGLILGFHGCDESVARNVISQNTELKPSENIYDWLGHGMYFWESSPNRALEFAIEQKGRKGSRIKKPAVLGAVIDLGFCFDLIDLKYLEMMKAGYKFLESTIETASMPRNKPLNSSDDLLFRDLDCAVIESIHLIRRDNKLKPFDSVRGVFWEGDELYPNAGFKEKNHIQICVRNPNCIKGFFLPRTRNKSHKSV
ncbi:MAG: hypothetical protein ACK4WD_02415 [Flavobacteriales bacterium]|jgi:hypothetical protein